MATEFRINIQGGGGGAAAAALQIQNRILQTLRQQSGILGRLRKDQEKFGQTASRGLGLIAINTQKTAALMAGSMAAAAKTSSRAWVLTAAKIRASMAVAFRGIGASLAGVGASLSGGLAGIFSGGRGLGGLTRGIGGLASGLVKSIGGLAASVTKGFTSMLGTAVSAIPFVGAVAGPLIKGLGSAISSALGAVASGASAIVGAAAQIGGIIVDKIVGVVKIGLVAGLGIAIFSAARAAKFENLEAAFDNLVKSIGGGEDTLEGFRKAAKGTVSDLDLMSAANNAVLLGTVDNTKQFEKLIDASRRLGKATGRTAKDALNDLSIGIGRQSRMILDNLGVIVRVKEANAKFAKQLGITVGAMTEANRRTSFLNAAMEGIDNRLAKLGPEVDTFGDTWNRITTAFGRATTAIGKLLIPAISSILKPMTAIVNGFREWLNFKSDAKIGFISRAIAGLTGALEGLADIVKAEGFGGVFQRIGNLAQAGWELVKNSAESAMKFMINRAKAFASDLPGHIWTGIKATLALLRDFSVSVADFLANPAKAAANLVIAFNKTVSFEPGDKIRAEGDKEQARLSVERNAILQKIVDQFAVPEPGAAIDPSVTPFFGPETVGSNIDKQREAAESGGDFAAFDAAFPKFAPGGGAGTGGGGGAAAIADASSKLVATAVNGAKIVETSIAEVTSKLEALIGGKISALPDAFREMIESGLEKAKDSQEALGKITEGIARAQKAKLQQAARAELDSLKQKERGAKKELAAREKATKAIVDGMADLEENARAAFEQIAQDLDQASQTIFNSFQGAAESVQNEANSLAQSFGGGLGIGPDEGLPLNVRKAIKKVKKQKRRDRRENLRRATSGLGSNDLAANGGALLQQVFQQQAERELSTQSIFANLAQAQLQLEQQVNAEATTQREEIIQTTSDLLDEKEKELEQAKKSQEEQLKTLQKFKEAIKKGKEQRRQFQLALKALGANV